MSTPEDPYAGPPGQPPLPGPPQQQVYYGQPLAAPYYYGTPPQNIPDRGVWFAIGAGSVIGLLLLGFAGIMLFAFAAGEPERGDYDDDYYYVEQGSVLRAVEGPCANMRSAASDIDMFSDPRGASADIKAYTLAIKGVVEAIDASDPNSDSKQWRDDWKSLGTALDTYADELAAKGTSSKFRPLTDGKQPLLDRMHYSSESNCEVPAVIVALDGKMTLDGDPIY